MSIAANADKSRIIYGESVVYESEYFDGRYSQLNASSLNLVSREIFEETSVNVAECICKEIVQVAMDIIHLKHLENTSQSFIVRCMYLASQRLFDWMSLKYDQEETCESLKKYWSPGIEPEPLKSDSWACGGVAVLRQPVTPSTLSTGLRNAVDDSKEQSQTVDVVTLKKHEEEIHKRSLESTLSNKATADFVSEVDRAEELSVFSQTINMPQQDLPVPKWLLQEADVCQEDSLETMDENHDMPAAPLTSVEDDLLSKSMSSITRLPSSR